MVLAVKDLALQGFKPDFKFIERGFEPQYEEVFSVIETEAEVE